MPFEKYVPGNNGQGQLLAGISAGAGSVILQSGQGGRFPSTFPYLCELKNVDTLAPYAVLKREIVKVTGKSGDTLTIVRSAGTCLQSDVSNTQGTTAYAFSSGDYITLTVTAETIKDIQDEVITKLATAGGVRTGLANNSILTTNASGNEVLLPPTAGHVVGFTGGGVPTTFVPTVDINGLTESSMSINQDMYIVNSGGNNRKISIANIRKSLYSMSSSPSVSTTGTFTANGTSIYTEYGCMLGVSAFITTTNNNIMYAPELYVEYSTDNSTWTSLNLYYGGLSYMKATAYNTTITLNKFFILRGQIYVRARTYQNGGNSYGHSGQIEAILYT